MAQHEAVNLIKSEAALQSMAAVGLATSHMADLSATKEADASELLVAIDQKLEAFRSEVHVAITAATQAATQPPVGGSTNLREEGTIRNRPNLTTIPARQQ